MKRRVGDRRDKARFDIVGNLWGRVETKTPMLVRNVCRGGALLESPVLLRTDSVHAVTIVAGAQRHRVRIRVRHSRPTPVGTGAPRYAIGVEFLDLPRAVREALAHLIVEDDDGLRVEA